jgi:hypothetical protein
MRGRSERHKLAFLYILAYSRNESLALYNAVRQIDKNYTVPLQWS